ncbi:Werner Syndrome-like exonuclease [Trichogramma pretiosum]|uniref:Werner Syndrome-like exonuclease n=1 Tax=Trichogramma pretiosum TaxID=7493 RepID=UPI0006C9462E|nr:Werner Syndrome-like exonuclease [Trichogramma pretiosum]
MSKVAKRQPQSAIVKSRSIKSWLKKEYLSTENENSAADAPAEKTESDYIKAKVLDRSLTVVLEPLSEKVANIAIADEENKKVKTQPVEADKKKTSKQEENTNSVQGLRRSARNLPADEKQEKVKRPKKTYIEEFPPILFQGSIKYTNDFYDCAKICDDLLAEVEKSSDLCIPIGFDLEWPFNFQTGSGKTALAQICLSEKECYLLHIYNLKKLPASFVLLLSHPKVKIVGVNIKNDVRKLTRDFKEFPGQKVVDDNCLDCGPYANRILDRSGRWSLKRLTEFLLEKSISKDPRVRNSKWHIHPLSEVQKIYAATDAYVSLLLYQTIKKEELLLEEAAAKEAAEIERAAIEESEKE